MINVTVYVRKDCQLCDEVLKDLQEIQEKIPHQLVLMDIENDESIREQFSLEIPVVETGPYRLKYPFSKKELEMTLAASLDRQTHLEMIGSDNYEKIKARSEKITRADRISYWISKHYLFILNLFVFLYIALPFMAPILKHIGTDPAAEIIYKVYKPLCHQWSFRSFFLFGEQVIYPHTEAKVSGVKTFEDVTGMSDENDPNRLFARNFEGNELLGYKVALCERDVGIWSAILIFGLLFAFSKRKIKGLNWVLWIILGILPIGLDGFSQVISQLNLQLLHNLLPYRESTPMLRTLTGFLFGFTTAWFGYPSIEEAMSDSRRILAKKFAVINTKS
jgi:uncharacterized membrane protein